MRQAYLYIVGALMLIGSLAQAQEAFYIYRNDNNFNGFFYDEVIRMECSKFGLDSVEHDEYVVQDIVLADTTYRIPLAVIDSISFIQPEIRFQPNVRFIGPDGYSPYLKSIGVDGTTLRFEELPDELVPEVGQILMGMPYDPIAETVYKENDTTRNSFGCVVTKVKKSMMDPDVIIVEGEPVTDYRQVFDQYITVERVLLDDKGNIIQRRIAGCTPDGMPRIHEGDDVEVGSYPLIDVTGKFSKEWGNDENVSKVDLNVDVRFQVILRASYNVSKWACFAKLTTDMIINAQPSVGMNINASFEKKGRIFYCLPIYFPQPCCIFMFNPAPYIFVRGQGMLRFSLNLPPVRLGLGMDYSFMPTQPLPLRASLHMVEPTEEEKKAAEENDSSLFSGDVTLEGFLQAGIMFNLSIATSDWLEYVLSASVGLYLYAGPKFTGHMKASTDMWGDNTAYNLISEQYLSFSWISATLEAKAEYWVVGIDYPDQEPETITFWDRTWEFLPDTLRLAPIFKKTEVYPQKSSYRANLNIRPARVFVDNTCYVGVFKSTDPGKAPIKKYGGWHFKSNAQQAFSMYGTMIDYTDFHAGDTVYIAPYYVMDGWGGLAFNLATDDDQRIIEGYMECPHNKDTIHLPWNPDPKYDMFQESVITNLPFKSISTGDWHDMMDSIRIVQDPEDWTKVTVNMYPALNATLFGKRLCKVDITAMSEPGDKWPFYESSDIYFLQDENDLSNIRIGASATFYDENGYYYNLDFDKAKVTAERLDAKTVTLEGANTSIDDDGIIKNQFIKMTLTKTGANMYGETFTATGTLRNETIIGTTVVNSSEIAFKDADNYLGYWINTKGDPIISGNHFQIDYDYEGNAVPSTTYLVPSENNRFDVHFHFERE